MLRWQTAVAARASSCLSHTCDGHFARATPLACSCSRSCHGRQGSSALGLARCASRSIWGETDEAGGRHATTSGCRERRASQSLHCRQARGRPTRAGHRRRRPRAVARWPAPAAAARPSARRRSSSRARARSGPLPCAFRPAMAPPGPATPRRRCRGSLCWLRCSTQPANAHSMCLLMAAASHCCASANTIEADGDAGGEPDSTSVRGHTEIHANLALRPAAAVSGSACAKPAKPSSSAHLTATRGVCQGDRRGCQPGRALEASQALTPECCGPAQQASRLPPCRRIVHVTADHGRHSKR